MVCRTYARETGANNQNVHVVSVHSAPLEDLLSTGGTRRDLTYVSWVPLTPTPFCIRSMRRGDMRGGKRKPRS